MDAWSGTDRAGADRVARGRQDLRARAFSFSARVLSHYRALAGNGAASAHIALQLVCSATSMGAQLEEAAVYSSRRDLAAKLTIALREAREANYWLRPLTTASGNPDRFAADIQESREFIAMLTTSVRKLRQAREDSAELTE